MKIGILQCGHAAPEVAADHGDYSQMFQRLLAGNGFEFASWDVVDMDFPESPRDADGWLLSGSRHGAYDDLPFIAPLEEFVRAAYAVPVPMVGICFGHQLIAQALGGRVEKFDGGWAVGRQDYAFGGLGNVALNAWHQDQVLDLPEGAEVVASNDFCRYAALRYGDRAYTVQPHPEFENPVIAKYVELRRGTADYPDAVMDRATAEAANPTENAVLAGEIARFFQQSAEA